MRKKILVTGAAGFVGFHSIQRLSGYGYDIVGLDNINSYYDVNLKRARLNILAQIPDFSFKQIDLSDRGTMAALFAENAFDVVLHLGAQAGVRYSIENPFAYIDSNVVGTMAILEGCRHSQVPHLIYASSSSVYGANAKLPFSIDDRVDSPISLYAATKKSNEMMCYTYAHLYKLRITGLRFFTVYGPWGRPDMAYFKFANAIKSGKTIDVYNNGDMQRDFTYIDDIVDGMMAIMHELSSPEGRVPHTVYNLGHNKPERLLDMIEILEEELGVVASKNFLPMQQGDVQSTFADIDSSNRDFGFSPKVSLRDGLRAFASWHKQYYA